MFHPSSGGHEKVCSWDPSKYAGPLMNLTYLFLIRESLVILKGVIETLMNNDSFPLAVIGHLGNGLFYVMYFQCNHYVLMILCNPFWQSIIIIYLYRWKWSLRRSNEEPPSVGRSVSRSGACWLVTYITNCGAKYFHIPYGIYIKCRHTKHITDLRELIPPWSWPQYRCRCINNVTSLWSIKLLSHFICDWGKT